MKDLVKCPNCKGKGHVLDGVGTIFFFGFGWILAPFETNNPEGLTRQTCDQCNGAGYIKPESAPE